MTGTNHRLDGRDTLLSSWAASPIPDEHRLRKHELRRKLIVDCRKYLGDDRIAVLFEQAATDRGVSLTVSAEDFSVTYEANSAAVEESLDVGAGEDLEQYLEAFFVDCWLALVGAAARIGLQQIPADRAAFEDCFHEELAEMRRCRANTTDATELPTNNQDRVDELTNGHVVPLKN